MSRYVGPCRHSQSLLSFIFHSFVPQADQDRSSPHDLAARTVAHLKAKSSVEEGAESSTTRFDLDEVSGPLKSAPGTDGVVDIDDTYEEEIKEQEGAWTHKIKREYAEQVKVWHTAFRLSCCSNLIFVFLVSSYLSSPVNPPQNGGSSGFVSSPIVLLVIGSCDSH
jgi:hypothetical protein